MIRESRWLRFGRGENMQFTPFFRVFLCVFCVFSSAGLAGAQSHPGWWTVVPPDSRSLVGIEWETLRNSPFGDALRGELSTGGSLALPNLPCLLNAHDFLMASPPLLAAANGGCTPATVRAEAPAHGLKLSTYRRFELWIDPVPAALSVCQFNERVVLIGSVKSLRAAVDRSVAETRTYSPLLIQGARLARTRDLWAVAAELPDPLASIFIPLEVTAGSVRNFEGGVTLREGLEVGAMLDTGSETAAAEVAGSIRRSIPQFPAVVKGLQVATNGSSVTLALQVANDVLQASLRRGDAEVASPIEPPVTFTPAPAAPKTSSAPQAPRASAAPAAPKAPAARPVLAASPAPTTAKPLLALTAAKPLPAPAAPSDAVVPAPTAAVAPVKPEPQIIRIYGLDGGLREIVLPPKEP